VFTIRRKTVMRHSDCVAGGELERMRVEYGKSLCLLQRQWLTVNDQPLPTGEPLAF